MEKPELLDIPDDFKALATQADEDAHDELAAAVSAAKKLSDIATIGLDKRALYVEPFSVAERKAMSLVIDYVQPPEMRSSVSGFAAIALGQLRYIADPSDTVLSSHAMRKAIRHASIALESLAAVGGAIKSNREAAADPTPSKFSSPASDALLAKTETDAAAAKGDEEALAPSAEASPVDTSAATPVLGSDPAEPAVEPAAEPAPAEEPPTA